MTIWDFFDHHWFIAFWAMCLTAGLIHALIRFPVWMKHGLPPKCKCGK